MKSITFPNKTYRTIWLVLSDALLTYYKMTLAKRNGIYRGVGWWESQLLYRYFWVTGPLCRLPKSKRFNFYQNIRTNILLEDIAYQYLADKAIVSLTGIPLSQGLQVHDTEDFWRVMDRDVQSDLID